MATISGRGVFQLVAGQRRLPLSLARGDLALALFVAALTTLMTATNNAATTRHIDAFAYGLGLASAALLLVRHRWPLGVLAATMAGEIGYNLLGYPSGGPWQPVVVALYTAGVLGARRRSLVLGAVVLAAMAGGHAIVTSTPEFSQATVLYIAVAGAALFLGDAVRSRRALVAEMSDRVRRAELEQEGESRRRVTEERLRIARDLHDVLAHTVTAITVQAGVAADLLDSRPDLARAALQAIRETSREATRELHTTLGVLRSEAGSEEDNCAPKEPSPGVDQIPGLVDLARRSGLEVALSIGDEVRPLPPAFDLAVYRIVQEALTNVMKHARAAHAEVSIRLRPPDLLVEIVDDGRGPGTEAATGGHGLTGMAERAAVLGGQVEAGTASGTGFRVKAQLPLDRTEP